MIVIFIIELVIWNNVNFMKCFSSQYTRWHYKRGKSNYKKKKKRKNFDYNANFGKLERPSPRVLVSTSSESEWKLIVLHILMSFFIVSFKPFDCDQLMKTSEIEIQNTGIWANTTKVSWSSSKPSTCYAFCDNSIAL